MLRFLQVLRNVKKGSILIRDAILQEVPDFVFHVESGSRALIPVMQDQDILKARLTLLVSGTSPVELLFEMYSALLRCGRGFEQNARFRTGMDISAYLRRDGSYFGYDCTVYGSEFSNPFRSDRYTKSTVFHPIEQGPIDTRRFSVREESGNFKNARASILYYLEPQYQRIEKAANNIVDFIKEHKRIGELFDPRRGPVPAKKDSAKICAAMVLLEEFADSFKRDMPFLIKWRYRKLQRGIEERYSITLTGQALSRLRTAFELDEFGKFEEMFRTAFEYLDGQYLEIVRVRKELFKWDAFNERGCDIEVDLSTCEERVDWDIVEPYVGVYAHDDSPEIDDESDVEM
jgi:hypothetical protein